jgi:hypothetical protein
VRGVGIVLGVAVLAGCGRLNFDAPTDGSVDATGDADLSDAAVLAPDYVALAFAGAGAGMMGESVVTDPTQIGDFLLVELSWGSTAGLTATLDDSHGTAFTVLPPVDNQAGTYRTYHAYGFATVAGVDNVVVTLDGMVDSFVQLRVLTFRDVDPTQPIDDTCGTVGSTNGPDSITCAVTTTQPNEALVIYSLVSPGGSSAGSNTIDICTDQGDATSLGQAGVPGLYEIHQTASVGDWVANGLAIRGRIAP